MNDTTVRIDGVEKTLSHFQAARLSVSSEVEKVIKDGAGKIRTRSRSRAPKKTGRLRKNIKAKRSNRGTGWFVKAYSYVSRFQEYGTKRGIKPKMFMHKTREELLPQINEDIMNKIKEVVKD